MADAPRDPAHHDPTGVETMKTFECEGNQPGDALDPRNKPKNVRGVEANFALKLANNPAKRSKLDEHKVAMLGKKRARQTVLINDVDAKQAGIGTVSTPRRPSRGVGEGAAETQNQLVIKDQRQSDRMGSERSNAAAPDYQNTESNGDFELASQGWSKKMNAEEPPSDGYEQSVPRQASLRQTMDSKQFKGRPVSSQRAVVAGQNAADQKPTNKRSLVSKKQSANNAPYHDTSIERLLQEVTSDKFWHNPDESELQSVPGSFESAEEYIRVFEPLLFEECRAQLYSSYEESLDSVSRDAHVMVRVRTVERRERGWYDVVVLPAHECKWTFKEGEVAILSFPRPGSAAQSSNSNRKTVGSNEDTESECGRLVGRVRRHMPYDTRDPIGAVIRFYVGNSSDSSCSGTNLLEKLQPQSTWYLTALGSLATTQREYVALHAFRRLNVQMQNAILQPSPEYFPKYQEQPPAMPDCFTPNFSCHLQHSFNGPQLSAIHWAAMHTAAGTSNGAVKKQEPWPFTLVQGPPGTGKTHTVWGMLNVIHLVQYQRYYAALLKKLAPESYEQVGGSSSNGSEAVAAGSMDEVLQSMNQNLFRTLPKLCPKPRMLVCAPSNAATDELLARVLDRGFIDGEMRVYRPDVARVGVDSQSRAAQAVSVERRTEQLLMKGRDEVIGWLHQLKCREQQLSQEIAILQRELNMVAEAGRSQGSFGVDPDMLAERDRNRDILLQKLAASVESRDKVLVEMSRLLILESRFRGRNFNLEDARASLEASFASEAEIVFTTVSSSGRKLFSDLSHGFDMVVIDEAAQASEVGVLPALSLGAARCVLVGDPQQLPATVISKAAGTLLYSRSLFERFQQAGCPTILLSVQYRMHPQIREFPSRYFYQGRLTDSESVVNLPDEAYYRDALMAPYVFYDISHGRESHRGGSSSYQNVHEAQFALRLYAHLQKFLKANGGRRASVGIITPYKLQLKCLQREFAEVMSTEEGKDIYINTVDAFQGQERDVIIMSCVRASNHGVGFVADIRRMNVALTRARRALWVIGNANALMQSEDWAALVADAKARKCFMDLSSIPSDFLPTYNSSNTRAMNSSNNTRNMRASGPRPMHFNMLSERRIGMRAGEDDHSNSFPRNGSYRNPDVLPGDRSGDNLQFGATRRPNSSNDPRRQV